ncbi:hypothetical protein [Gloeocapsopsis dulcis]|nr:hypothetical protein [Gloeocapsopsis dulcis]WNN90392.1 hypothetical protein P0S91_04675 [Gloeocapsopsis dulcis]
MLSNGDAGAAERLMIQVVSGAKAEGQGLDEALAYLRAGDVLN